MKHDCESVNQMSNPNLCSIRQVECNFINAYYLSLHNTFNQIGIYVSKTSFSPPDSDRKDKISFTPNPTEGDCGQDVWNEEESHLPINFKRPLSELC